MDIFYIDESHDNKTYVMTAVAVPFLRPANGTIHIVWRDYFAAIKQWRKVVASDLSVPIKKELHGVKLISGRGNFFKGKYNFDRPKASSVYRKILSSIDFLPDASILSASANRGGTLLYGNQRLEAALHALFQRMRKQCEKRRVNAIVFFDQGHPEYRKLYRRAQIFLQTGSNLGGWSSGQTTKNLPLDMFVKDGNEKSSAHCFFTQLADVIAYSAFLKMKYERNDLTDWQSQYHLESLYDEIPKSQINTNVSYAAPRDGIVRLK